MQASQMLEVGQAFAGNGADACRGSVNSSACVTSNGATADAQSPAPVVCWCNRRSAHEMVGLHSMPVLWRDALGTPGGPAR